MPESIMPEFAGLSQADQADLVRRFSYHPPKVGDVDRFQTIRAAAKALAECILVTCPAGRERSSSLTRLEECVMHANASIAREIE